MTIALFEELQRINEAQQRQINRLTVLSQRAEVAGAVSPIAFADLPANDSDLSNGRKVYFCTNCLKCGETTGNGTGTLVYDDGAAWRRVCDDGSASI